MIIAELCLLQQIERHLIKFCNVYILYHELAQTSENEIDSSTVNGKQMNSNQPNENVTDCIICYGCGFL